MYVLNHGLPQGVYANCSGMLIYAQRASKSNCSGADNAESGPGHVRSPLSFQKPAYRCKGIQVPHIQEEVSSEQAHLSTVLLIADLRARWLSRLPSSASETCRSICEPVG